MFSKKIGRKDLGQLVTAYCFKCDTTTTGYSGFGYSLKGFKQEHTCTTNTYHRATQKAIARHTYYTGVTTGSPAHGQIRYSDRYPIRLDLG